MMVIFLCVVAYAIFIASDFFKLYRKNELSAVFFISGIVLLTFCLMVTISESDIVLIFGQKPIFSVVMVLLACLFLFLFLHSLFFTLPAKETYFGSNDLKLVDTGAYALCRHPGVIWLGLCFLFVWLFLDSITMLWLGITSTVLDIIYVFIQDVYIFPKTIERYDEYKKYTPFIIPNIESIRRSIKTWKNAREKR